MVKVIFSVLTLLVFSVVAYEEVTIEMDSVTDHYDTMKKGLYKQLLRDPVYTKARADFSVSPLDIQLNFLSTVESIKGKDFVKIAFEILVEIKRIELKELEYLGSKYPEYRVGFLHQSYKVQRAIEKLQLLIDQDNEVVVIERLPQQELSQ